MTDKQRLNTLRRAVGHLQNTTQGYKSFEESGGKGTEWRAAMSGLALLDQDLRPSPIPNIGPVQPGGKSLLDMSLTHDTSGIPLFPAVDTAWGGGGGVTVCTPEACTVDTKDTSAAPGEAVYLRGRSGLRYWIGHLNRDWPLGTKFSKGAVIGKTLPIPGSSDHAHVGVNAEALLGKGEELHWGGAPNRPRKRYQLGSPTIRTQLEQATH